MRTSLLTLVFMSLMTTPVLFAAEVLEPFLPEGVTFGMTCDAVQAKRPGAFKPDIPILPLSAVRAKIEKNEPATLVTLMDAAVQGNPVVMRHYYFPDQKLAAVIYVSAYSILLDDGKPLFQELREVLDKNLKKQTDERITRLSRDEFKPEEKSIESWKDPEGGIAVLFEVEGYALRCTIYDTRVYSKADFYMIEGDDKILEPAIQSITEANAKLTPEEVKAEKERQERFEKMRQEARKQKQNP